MDRSFDVRDEVRSLTYCIDDSIIAAALADGKIKLLNLGEQESTTLRGHRGQVFSIDYRANEKQLISLGSDDTLRFWDILTGKQLRIMEKNDWKNLPDTMLTDIGFNPKSGEAIVVLTGDSRYFAHSSDGSMFASKGFDSTVKIWDAKTKTELATFKAHEKPLQGVWFSQDTSKLYTFCAAEKSIKIWDIKSRRALKTIPIPLEKPRCCAFHPQGKMFAAAGGKDICIIDLNE